MTNSDFDTKLAEATALAHALGNRLKNSLIGDRHPADEKVEEVYNAVEWEMSAKLDDLFDTDKDNLDRSAADGVTKGIITESSHKVIKWRIEKKAESCASALMEAKRCDPVGVIERGQIYDKAYGDLRAFIKAVIPDDTDLGWTFARPIMDAVDKEVKDGWWPEVQGVGEGVRGIADAAANAVGGSMLKNSVLPML